MSAARKLLEHLSEIGASLAVEGDRLILSAGPSPVPGVVIQQMRQSKADLLDLLASMARSTHAVGETQPEDDGDFVERAALVAEGAQVPDNWAREFAQLDRARPPKGFPPDDWRKIIDRAGGFLDDWAGRAIKLGWEPLDLFGFDPVAPGVRRDRSGLLGSLADGEVVAITAETATLQTDTGGLLTFRRGNVAPGGKPVWELLPPHAILEDESPPDSEAARSGSIDLPAARIIHHAQRVHRFKLGALPNANDRLDYITAVHRLVADGLLRRDGDDLVWLGPTRTQYRG